MTPKNVDKAARKTARCIMRIDTDSRIFRLGGPIWFVDGGKVGSKILEKAVMYLKKWHRRVPPILRKEFK